MKKVFILIFMALAAAPLFAVQYENPMLDMVVPSGLTDRQMYFNFGHKMMQDIKTYPSGNTFALLKNGASLNLNVRYMICNGIEVKAAYDSIADEKNIGVSWVQKFPALFFNAQADLQFFSYDYPSGTLTAKNFLYLLSVQSVPLLDDRITAVINAGYDGYFEKPVMGIGLSVMVIKDITLIGEIYPVFEMEDEDGPAGPEKNPCYGFGIRYSTYGHQFMLKFGNSTQMEPRMLMQGTTANNLYVGLSIMRLIDFNPEEQQ